MKTAKERLWERMRAPRVMTSISLRIPENVVNDLKEIAPMLGFSGYQSLIKAYISNGVRSDLEKLEDSRVVTLTEELRKLGIADGDISAVLERAGLLADKRNLLEAFADNLHSAIAEKDRCLIAKLIEAIPARAWRLEPGRATVDYMGVRLQVDHNGGGSGINTYDSVVVFLLLPQGNSETLGVFTSEELMLPNYIRTQDRAPRAVAS